VPVCYTSGMGRKAPEDERDHYTAKPLARLIGRSTRTATQWLKRLEALYGPPVVVRIARGRAMPAPYARLLAEGRLPLDGSALVAPSPDHAPATGPHLGNAQASTSAVGAAEGGPSGEGSVSPYSAHALAARLALLEAQVSDIARVLRLRGILRRE
jgi:hypothetical protein